jgi:CRISPR/Cas system CMR subunit Cmr6 (Cas7 group RAMP superfamily)
MDSSHSLLNTPYIVGSGLKSTKKANLFQVQENEEIRKEI